MTRSDEARWVDTRAAAIRVGLHADTLRKMRREGGGPRFVRVPGTTAIRYSVDELDRWMAQATFTSTAEEAAGGVR